MRSALSWAPSRTRDEILVRARTSPPLTLGREFRPSSAAFKHLGGVNPELSQEGADHALFRRLRRAASRCIGSIFW